MGRIFLLIIDAHPKWMDNHCVNSATSKTTISNLRSTFASHGQPEILMSDHMQRQRPNKLWTILCDSQAVLSPRVTTSLSDMQSQEVFFSEQRFFCEKWLIFLFGGFGCGQYHGWPMVNIHGQVVRGPISANPRSNCNLGFFIPLFKSLLGIIFCVLFRASNSHILDKNNSTEFSLRAFKSEISFTRTLDYLNLALNNPALVCYSSIGSFHVRTLNSCQCVARWILCHFWLLREIVWLFRW